VCSFNEGLDSIRVKAVSKGIAELFNNLSQKQHIHEMGHAFFSKLFYSITL
jgi:hypothetical protein